MKPGDFVKVKGQGLALGQPLGPAVEIARVEIHHGVTYVYVKKDKRSTYTTGQPQDYYLLSDPE